MWVEDLKIVSLFFLPQGVKRTICQDPIKILEFCKMFWIANNACDTVNRKNYLYLLYGSY